MFKDSLDQIQTVLDNALQAVKLVAVTKKRSALEVDELLSLGVKIVGENRIQEAAMKFPLLKFPCEKHMIGHLQTNKVKQALELFDLIESVDSLRLANKLETEAAKIGKIMPVLLEVNIAKEEQKYGVKVQELGGVLEEIKKLSHIKVKGLMCMPPFSANPENSRPYFREMRKLLKQFELSELSMGSSQDWQVAVEEGATLIRVGRSLTSSL